MKNLHFLNVMQLALSHFLSLDGVSLAVAEDVQLAVTDNLAVTADGFGYGIDVGNSNWKNDITKVPSSRILHILCGVKFSPRRIIPSR